MEASDNITSIIDSFKQGKLGIFCGAGISKNSGLPLANELKQYILEKLTADNNVINKIMMSALPFEEFMEIIATNSNAWNILRLFAQGEPNTNHIVLARLAKLGIVSTITTTNFDLLIEKALDNEGLIRNKHYRVFANEDDFGKLGVCGQELISVIKLHGSIDDLKSIRTTLALVAGKTLSDKRMNAIKYTFSTSTDHNVLVLGYSCSDEFDITPHIRAIDGEKKEIIFISHTKNEQTIEEIRSIQYKNPYKAFPGFRIKTNTDNFVKILWTSFPNIGEYFQKKGFIKWRTLIDDWASTSKQDALYRPFIVGFCLRSISDFKGAIEYYRKTLDLAKEIGDKSAQARSCGNIGNSYLRLGQTADAEFYLNECLKYAVETGDSDLEASCWGNLNSVYKIYKDPKKISISSKKEWILLEQSEKKIAKAMLYFKQANFFNNTGNLPRAVELYEKCLLSCRANGNIVIEAACLLCLGVAYRRSKAFERSIELLEQASLLFGTVGERSGLAACFYGLGASYFAMRNTTSAIECYTKALEINVEIGNTLGQLDCCTSLAKAFYVLENYKESDNYKLQAATIREQLKT
jgi:tetratricopeptide (TPR) repeat protein